MNQKTAKLLRKYAADRELSLAALCDIWQETPRRKRAEFRRMMKRAVG